MTLSGQAPSTVDKPAWKEIGRPFAHVQAKQALYLAGENTGGDSGRETGDHRLRNVLEECIDA
jgi:hypothetical protein